MLRIKAFLYTKVENFDPKSISQCENGFQTKIKCLDLSLEGPYTPYTTLHKGKISPSPHTALS